MTSRGTIAARIYYSHGNAGRRYLHVVHVGLNVAILYPMLTRHELNIHLRAREKREKEREREVPNVERAVFNYY